MERKEFYPKDYMNIEVGDLLGMMFDWPISIVKKLYPLLGKEKALALVNEAVSELASRKASYYHGPPTPFRSFEEVLSFFSGIFVDNYKGPLDPLNELVQKTVAVEDMKIGKNEVTFKITRCLWAKICKEMGAPEVGKIMYCDFDFPHARWWSPKLKLEKKQTIMEGAPHCDFRYIWEE